MNLRHPLVLRLLRGKELTQAARLVGRAMRDNPANVAVFRTQNAEHRSIAMRHFFVPVLGGIYQRGLVLGAFGSNGLVGICGMTRPGFCRPGPIEKVRVFPKAMSRNSIGTPLRILHWVGEWPAGTLPSRIGISAPWRSNPPCRVRESAPLC